MGKPTPEVTELVIGDERLVVISVPATSVGDAGLTAAERSIAEDILAGRSNGEIARRRGTSSRTVANQIASLFRKLDVMSRAELVARLYEP